MVLAARRNALLVSPLGPPNTFFCSTTATFLPSLLAVIAVVSPPIPINGASEESGNKWVSTCKLMSLWLTEWLRVSEWWSTFEWVSEWVRYREMRKSRRVITCTKHYQVINLNWFRELRLRQIRQSGLATHWHLRSVQHRSEKQYNHQQTLRHHKAFITIGIDRSAQIKWVLSHTIDLEASAQGLRTVGIYTVLLTTISSSLGPVSPHEPAAPSLSIKLLFFLVRVR